MVYDTCNRFLEMSSRTSWRGCSFSTGSNTSSIYVLLVDFCLTIFSTVALGRIAPHVFANKTLGRRQLFAHEELVCKALQRCIAEGLRNPPLLLRWDLGSRIGRALVRREVVLERERPRAKAARKPFLLEVHRTDVLIARKLAQIRARTTRPRAPEMLSALDRLVGLDVRREIPRSLANAAASTAHVRLRLGL